MTTIPAIRDGGPRWLWRSCVALLLVLGLSPIDAGAAEDTDGSRQARIEALSNALAGVRLPLTEEVIAPSVPRLLAVVLLKQLGRQQKLGERWSPESPYWIECEVLVSRHFNEAYQSFSKDMEKGRVGRIRAKLTRWPAANVDRAMDFLRSPAAAELGPDIDAISMGILLLFLMPANDTPLLNELAQQMQERKQQLRLSDEKRPSAAFMENEIAQQIGAVVQQGTVIAFIAEFDPKAVLDPVAAELAAVVRRFQADQR